MHWNSCKHCVCCVLLQLWQCPTQGPVFSSPCFIREQRKLLCGSHDGRLYCLSAADGSVVWTFQTPGRVYSSPCVFDGCGGGALVALASTDGTVWILEAENGQMLASHALPGELFSSPVVWAGCLVIGCRNDYVYALNLTYKEDAWRMRWCTDVVIFSSKGPSENEKTAARFRHQCLIYSFHDNVFDLFESVSVNISLNETKSANNTKRCCYT